MKITNTFNLPAPIVRAITNDPYNKGDCDFSTTGLIKPARIVALENQHKEEITEDAADRIWSLIGQVGHLILERAGGDDITEKRLFMTVTVGGKQYRISGQVDLIIIAGKNYLHDYKFTSVFAAKDGLKPEWEQQLNINREICEANGIPIEGAGIVAIFRDWSKGRARRESDFPQSQVQLLESPLWQPEKTIQFISDRIIAHIEAQETLPLCTEAERWARATTYAIKKKGGARAISGGVHTTLDDAERHLASLGTVTHELETCRGENIRCQDYCPVADFCTQWKALQQEK